MSTKTGTFEVGDIVTADDRPSEKFVVAAVVGQWIGIAPAAVGDKLTGDGEHKQSNRIVRKANQLKAAS